MTDAVKTSGLDSAHGRQAFAFKEGFEARLYSLGLVTKQHGGYEGST